VDPATSAPGDPDRTWWQRRTGGLDGRCWRLWGAVATSDLGDGPVSLPTRLPWSVFNPQAGVLGDRLDRRPLMAMDNRVRALVATVVTVAVVLDAASLPLLYLAAVALHVVLHVTVAPRLTQRAIDDARALAPDPT